MGEFGILIFFWPLLYLIIAVLVIKVVLHIVKGSRKKKWVIGLSLAFLFYLPLGWDVILGRAYFYYLCSSQAGVHVYEKVTIDAKYFAPDAEPNYFNPEIDGYFRGYTFKDFNIVDGRYYGERKKIVDYSKQFNISKRSYSIIDKSKSKLLADHVSYIYYGGWFMNKGTPFGAESKVCPSRKKVPVEIILNRVFIPL